LIRIRALTSEILSLDLTVPGSSKHGRDEESGDESPPSKVARGGRGVNVETQNAEDSSASASCTASGLQAIVSELSGEIRKLKGRVILMGDMAMMSDGISTRNTAKSFVCKHCCGGSGLGDEDEQKSVEK
jgi:hypothetical protein